MLVEVLNCRADILAFGARKHAALVTESADAVAECLARDDWCCHVCGIRFLGFMEVDHVDVHEPCAAASLRTICQFCHNLKHPVWASLRGRLRLIWAPGLTQSAINRMAWQALFASYGPDEWPPESEFADAARTLVADIHKRERVLADILGSADPEGFLEALFAVKSLSSNDAFRTVVARLDGFVRFWPVAADRVAGIEPSPAAGLGRWSDGRFIDLSSQAIDTYWHREITVAHLLEICDAEIGVDKG